MNDLEFDSQEIQKAFPKYKFERSLGKGAFGKVFLVTDRETGKFLAVKKINCFGMCEYERNGAINEVRILASLDHPNVIKFISGMFDSNEDDLYLFMEYAPQGDLAGLIQRAKQQKKHISQAAIWNILMQIADGLQYLHKNHIIHRDIKPANIFKTSKGVYKLADMNVSKIVANGDLAKTKAGSPLYASPQIWTSEEGYNQKCDIWSLGVVVYEMCCLRVPYEANSIDELLRKQKTMRLKNLPTRYSAALNEVVHQMLQFNANRRIAADKIKVICLKNLKIENQETSVPLDSLIDTIVIPESDQRWINLVPLPPRIKKQNFDRKDSKEKSSNDIAVNKSNIFSSLQNRSALIPKSRNSQQKPIRVNSQQKPIRVRLPSISRKNSKDSLHEGERLSQGRQKSREGLQANTPERKSASSSRITRKS